MTTAAPASSSIGDGGSLPATGGASVIDKAASSCPEVAPDCAEVAHDIPGGIPSRAPKVPHVADGESVDAHWDGWHEVAAGGIYDTAESHVVVAKDLSKIPEVV